MQIIEVDGVYRSADYAELEVEAHGHEAPLKRWVILCDTREFPGEFEEIDVDAHTKREARQVADAAIARDYDEGLRVHEIQGPHLGLYL